MASERRLIDANALLAEISEDNPRIYLNPYEYVVCSSKIDGELVHKRADVLRAIESAPTVDAVEVEDRELLEAIKILVEKYGHCKLSDYVHSPVAHALYHTWRKLDGEREDK